MNILNVVFPWKSPVKKNSNDKSAIMNSLRITHEFLFMRHAYRAVEQSADVHAQVQAGGDSLDLQLAFVHGRPLQDRCNTYQHVSDSDLWVKSAFAAVAVNVTNDATLSGRFAGPLAA